MILRLCCKRGFQQITKDVVSSLMCDVFYKTHRQQDQMIYMLFQLLQSAKPIFGAVNIFQSLFISTYQLCAFIFVNCLPKLKLHPIHYSFNYDRKWILTFQSQLLLVTSGQPFSGVCNLSLHKQLLATYLLE